MLNMLVTVVKGFFKQPKLASPNETVSHFPETSLL